MSLRRRLVLLGASALALGACDRIDPLAVIDSPDGLLVIQDELGTRSKRRFICIRAKKGPSCSTHDAEVIIASVGPAVELSADWDTNSQVVIRVTSGTIERAASAALNGRVNIRVEE